LKREITKQIVMLDGNDILSGREAEINGKLKEAIRKSEELVIKEFQTIKKDR